MAEEMARWQRNYPHVGAGLRRMRAGDFPTTEELTMASRPASANAPVPWLGMSGGAQAAQTPPPMAFTQQMGMMPSHSSTVMQGGLPRTPAASPPAGGQVVTPGQTPGTGVIRSMDGTREAVWADPNTVVPGTEIRETTQSPVPVAQGLRPQSPQVLSAAQYYSLRDRGSAPVDNSFGGMVQRALTQRLEKGQAAMENARANLGLQARGQDITTRGQDLVFQTAQDQNAIEAARNEDLAMGLRPQAEAAQMEVDRAKVAQSLFEQYMAATDEAKKAVLAEQYRLATKMKEPAPKVFQGTELGAGGDRAYVLTEDPSAPGGFRKVYPQEQGSTSLRVPPPAAVARMKANMDNEAMKQDYIRLFGELPK